MTDDDLARKLASFKGRGYVIAPAGYGKTHLIALAVKASDSRQLVLTHTYAGVDSIRNKLRRLKVPPTNYQLDTIASWALRLCCSFPTRSGWNVPDPSGEQWADLYLSCARLLSHEFIKHVVRSSYGGVFVDEYQDCSRHQHTLVAALSKPLGCRLLGDPLQAIFDFADTPVDWDTEIYPHYELLGSLKVPWRWKLAGTPALGEWLDNARKSITEGNRLSLSTGLPKEVSVRRIDLGDFKNPKRLTLFYDFLKNNDSVIAIYSGDARSKNKTHQLSKSLAGRFSSIEELEGKELFAFLRKIDSNLTPKGKLLAVIDFAKKCFTSIDDVLTSGTKRGERSKSSKTTRFPELLDSANAFLEGPSTGNLKNIFLTIRNCSECKLCRRDLVNRLMNALSTHLELGNVSLTEAARIYQLTFRHSGRPVRHRKLIATTLLVKGLEYQHAIVLEADAFSPKELYVALTRGAKSVTIVTTASEIPQSKKGVPTPSHSE